jgi:hypothetical protein
MERPVSNSRDRNFGEEAVPREFSESSTGTAHILVLEANAHDPSFWRASRRLDRCGPAEVQHDGGVFMVPRRDGDGVCRHVMATHIATGAQDPAFIVKIGSDNS